MGYSYSALCSNANARRNDNIIVGNYITNSRREEIALIRITSVQAAALARVLRQSGVTRRTRTVFHVIAGSNNWQLRVAPLNENDASFLPCIPALFDAR